MSEIFGIYAPGRSPIDPADIELMAAANGSASKGAALTWCASPIALGCVVSDRTTTQRLLHHAATGVSVACASRLDNRSEIIDRLGIKLATDLELSDAHLILESYLRYGESCVQHLLGDWTISIWDPRERKLILARDPIGAYPLYYHTSANSLTFSSTSKRLLAAHWIPKRPDLLRVGQVLATWPTDGVRTGYEGVCKLLAGHMLVSREGAHEVRRFWSPDSIAPLKLGCDQDYIDAFLEVYSEAVRCRLPLSGRPGVTLSGGLDSGSVAALAARELRRSGKTLEAFSSAPAFAYPTPPGRFSDETSFIEANRDMLGNLHVHYVRAEDISPLGGIDRTLDLLNEPLHAASNAYWIIGILRAAQDRGIENLLTGQMGNFTVSWRGDRFASPFQKAKLHFLISWAKPLRNQARRLANRGQDAWLAHSPLNHDFAAKMRIDRLRREAGYDPNFVTTTNPHQERRSNIERNLRASGSYLNEMGAEYGIQTSDPTSDKRIVEFCLSAPVEVFARDGMDRRLVRKAMEGLLPDKVRLNKTKGWQGSDLAQRIIRSASEIDHALGELENNSLAADVLNLPKMRRVFDAVQQKPDLSNTYAAGTILMRGLSAGRFLTRF